MARRKPVIDRIVHTSGRHAGRPVGKLRPGTVIRIEGSGFGENASACVALFDEVEATPYEMAFSPDAFLVAVPLPAAATDSLRVRVGEAVSDPVDCRVVRPGRPRRPPGSEIRAYYAEVDEFAAATAALALAIAPGSPMGTELRAAASMLNGYRASLQRTVETLAEMVAVQDTLTLPANLQTLSSIRRLDEALRDANAVGELASWRRAMYGPAGRFAVSTPERGKVRGDQVLFVGDDGDADESFGSSVVGLIGFILHEVSKALEGVEDLFDLYQPSIALTAEVVVGAAVDVTVDLGGAVSAIAKVVDIIGQILTRIGDAGDAAALDAKLGRLEAKLDALGSTVASLAEVVGALGARLDGLATAIAGLEEKGDRAELKLDRLEGKQDRATVERATLVELLGILEGKSDASAIELGRQEEKLDRLESKADRAEEKLDALETKADRAEEKLDALETKADRAEEKLDALETKADRAEEKLDRQETKADRAEQKLDALEMKADREEEKLDRLEVKLDRLGRLAPLEGAVASQRGGSTRVTAAVAATDVVDNSVNIRAAVDVAPARLDEEPAWSAWVDFGRPQDAAGILEASLDLGYEDGSDESLTGLLSVRDETARVFHRSLEARSHTAVIDPDQWSDWQRFLDRP